MPRNLDISTDIHRKDLRVLLIPFTADLNIPKFDPDESNEEYTEKTREYWARVTHAFFKEPKLRSKDPYFKTFAEIILGNLEGRDKTVQIYEQFPQIGRFAMIDTVISGRASNDILGAFDQISAEQQQRGIIDHANISPFAFLIVDENSEKLEKHQGFNAYLKKKKDKFMAQLYPIPRIVSEDKNSALLGVSATVYPSLMRASKSMEYDGREFFIGAGSWHVNSESAQFKHFLKFMEMVYSGIDVIVARYGLGSEHSQKFIEEFNGRRNEFIEVSDQSGVLNSSESDIASDPRLKNLNRGATVIYETRSHVVHVPFSDKITKDLVSEICGYPSVQCKVVFKTDIGSDIQDRYEPPKTPTRKSAMIPRNYLLQVIRKA